MIIQCPSCTARYRTKDLAPDNGEVRVECPKCQHLFLLRPNPAGSEPPVLIASRPRVLVVDDAHFFREMLLDLLAPLELNMELAANADEAWQQLQQESFELVILDLNLPDKNGLQLMKEIRAERNFSALKLLAMSGVYRKDDDATAAIRSGADDFLNKSFKPEELRQRVEKLLGQ